MAPFLDAPIDASSDGLIDDNVSALYLRATAKSRKKQLLAWGESNFSQEDTHIYYLSERERREVYSALQGFLDHGLDGDEVNQKNFHLPVLGPQLISLTFELHNEKGLFVVRGLDPDDYSDEDNLIIFLGISSYIGNRRGKQTDDGGILGHIYNPTEVSAAQHTRPLKYSKRFAAFHNDIGCDILAMQTRSLPEIGGEHLYASVAEVFDHIVCTRPDLAQELLKPDWPFDIRRRWSATETHAVVFEHEGRVIATLFPDALIGFDDVPRPEGLPALTAKQREALTFVQQTATARQLRMSSQPGDITFVNNLAIVHGREAFEDSPDQSRYLIRMWLKNEEMAWSLPEPFKVSNEMVFYDRALTEKWNISKVDDVKFQIYERHTP